MDEDAHEVRRGGEPIDLIATEFNLLRYLLLNAGRVVSKAQILDHVWSYDFGGDGSVVETYVYYLRRKVDTCEPPLIHTVRGVGLRAAAPKGLSAVRAPIPRSLRGRLLLPPWPSSPSDWSWPVWPRTPSSTTSSSAGSTSSSPRP